jgi:hypothetical protein
MRQDDSIMTTTKEQFEQRIAALHDPWVTRKLKFPR